MRLPTLAVPLALVAALGRAHAAKERGAFVVTLGRDTTSVERHVFDGDRLEIEIVERSPRVLRRRFVYEYLDGALLRMSMEVTPPGAVVPTERVLVMVDGDTLHSETTSVAAAPVLAAMAIPPGTLLTSLASPWAVYQAEIQRLLQSRAPMLAGRVLYLGAANTERWLLRRLGPDSVAFSNTRHDLFHARVDRKGRILGTRALGGTFRVEARRIPEPDLDALSVVFQSREQSGRGLGTLSPRDTVRVALAAGATVTIDYGRPAKRGRMIFGSLVPYGEVWRTGANAATQFRTDRALNFGGTVLPAGSYSLWTIPGREGWKLLFNGETGQWGTAYQRDRDLRSVDLRVSALPEEIERFTISVVERPSGGVLQLDWDTTRASVEFVVQPE